jgi:DNA-binding transcriptional regulator YiaG
MYNYNTQQAKTLKENNMTSSRAKEIIKKLGLTQAEFSRMVGSHKGYIYNFDRYGVPKSMALALLAIEKLSTIATRDTVLEVLNSEEVKK